MKTIILVLSFLLLWAFTAYAGDINLKWKAPDKNADDTPISFFAGNYRIHYGPLPGKYSTTIDLVDIRPDVSYDVSDMPENTVTFFMVTAINTLGNESVPSNEVGKMPNVVKTKELVIQ